MEIWQKISQLTVIIDKFSNFAQNLDTKEVRRRTLLAFIKFL